jgi:anti-sigma factor RsiW
MNCRKVQSLISAYVDCELPGVEMLSVRQHLNECTECNSEYECLLRVKRAFGSLDPQAPSPALAERIFLRLDQLAEAPQDHFLSSLRKHLTFFPGRLRFAAASMGAIAVLLTIRSGQIYNTTYSLLPPQAQVQAASLGVDDPGTLFPATSHVKDAHMGTPPPAPAAPWAVDRNSDSSGRIGGTIAMASYTVSR